jgi:NADPH-dependent curcumin reductase CurA
MNGAASYAPAAFISMLEGRNFGKALVRVTP